MKNKMQIPSVFIGQLAKSALVLAVLAISFTACKDDDDNVTPGGDGGGTEKVFIPSKDKSYHYKVSDSDGSDGTMISKIVSTKDSAGMPVHTIHNIVKENEEEMTLVSKAYAKSGTTINELPYPTALKTLVNEINDIAYIADFKLTGFPHYQYLENNGKVNSPLTFKGDPIKILMKLEIPVGEEGSVDAALETKLTYKNGKAIGDETITTTAGEFKCTKWEYSYEVYTKFETEVTDPEITTELYNVTLWTAPGVGVVRSIEKSKESTSTTELRKID